MPHSKRTATGVLGGLLGLVGLSAIAGMLVTAAVTPAVAVTSSAATGAIDMFNNLPSVLTIDKLILPSTIYATDDKGKNTVLATYYDQNRSPVTFDQVNRVMYDAVLSSEDPRFYEHGGIDLIGTTRALLSNLKGGETQGGSSISQQYVKNVLVQQCDWEAKTDEDLQKCFLQATDAEGADGYQRKLQEMRYAIALEQRYSKNDILLGYLNIANFGGTTYGIDAAAMRYFSVHANKLSLAQAAVLAGMVQNPNVLRIDMPKGSTTDSKGTPINTEEDGYKVTKQRQEYVLDRMLADGKITKEQHDEAYKAPIKPKLSDPSKGCGASIAPYFCAYVTSVVLNDPAFGKDADARRTLLRKGGLKIYTTLDTKLQKAAQKAQNDIVPAKVSGLKLGSTSVSVEASTGNVLAMTQNTKYTLGVGKKVAGESPIVFAGDKTHGGSIGFSAGSTFKLFTLLDWLDKGHSVNELVDGRNRPISTWKDHCVAGGVWTATAEPRNFANQRGYFGTPMRFTAQSLNTGFMGMAEKLDLCDIGNTAQSLGVRLGNGEPLPMTTDGTAMKKDGVTPDNARRPAPNEVIGNDAVSPLAMAGAFAAVANKGVFCEPRVISKVIGSDGEELPLPDKTCKQTIDPKVAATAIHALQGVMRGSGSGAAGNPHDGTPLFGKTGTHEAEQTWLVTANSKVATANWVGNIEGKGDLFHTYAGWNTLSNLRFPLARSVQSTVNQLYPGDKFPEPDSTLTRRVLVNLPNVVGMSEDQAKSRLTRAGFSVTVGSKVDSDLPEGMIAAQSPEAGRTAGGTNVTISPSNGHGIKVPDVTGHPADEAVAMLRGAGFGNVNTQCQQNDDGDGRVTTMSPVAGTVAGGNTAVTVTYQAKNCGGDNGDKADKGNKGNKGKSGRD